MFRLLAAVLSLSFELLSNPGLRCRAFFRRSGHSGPCAADRPISSIGALLPIALCGRSLL
jgi:hypothetical protein